ncbi:PqiA/YebS family transporter subunit [Gallaecimonas kandeliae]|uniref:PqiA/YebS family transporter subunit n=1 Tax=Gallaecimonas kandeliae TaxID=3029055 RepID=UPI00264870C0|nr:PqiA/YebS family transporter subunit [Gallaecimonas kandeliae]WKE67381.1 PqiA/YebS family transporter subunit [Gallaecimonas kandeliae]
MSEPQLVCPYCQLQMSGCVLDTSHNAWCPRCGSAIAEGPHLAVRWMVSLALVLLGASLSLLVMPLISFDVLGLETDATLLSGITKLAQEGQWLPSLMVFLTALAAPVLVSVLLLVVLFAPDGYMRRQSLVALGHLKEWCMLDILLVGLCVSMVKLADIGDLNIKAGMACLIMGQLAMAALIQGIRPVMLWQSIAEQPMTPIKGLRPCAGCHALNVPTAVHCWRCQRLLESRPRQGKQLCWMLLLASVILLVPANVLPMSFTTSFGSTGSDTIFTGVVTLARNGSPTIAAIVFIASVVVPIGKILLLSTILYLSDHKSLAPRTAQKIYRLVHFIGRWSMLDIFVIAIMVTLVDQGFLSQFRVGPAATPFALVVVLTMVAAMRFDTRWLWIQDEKRRRQNVGQT